MKYNGLTGRVVTPGDPEYEQARQEYNEAIDSYPAAIVYCFNPCDVANAIIWSREQGIKLRIRSGGHNYEGYSTGTNKLVIDTTCMSDIKVDIPDGTVEVQAGTRLLSLYERLYQYGYTFPGGTCPTVAISGLVLGGGIGLSTRYLGLTADSLVEAVMVDASGNKLKANHDCNPELFWALRGAGGGNFGVVTGYKFRLSKKVNKITLIQLRWDNNTSARIQFLRVWQEWLPHLDRRMSAFGGIYKLGAWVNAFFYGRPEEARQILAPLLNISGITLDNIQYVPFIDAVKIIGAGYPKREAFQTAGRFVHRHFLQSELEKLIDIIDKAPSDRNSSIRVYSLGGTVRDTDINATAFFYRQADYIMAITSSWESKDEASAHKEWVKKGFDYIYTITRGSYVNFPYNRTPNYEQAYSGEYVPILRCVKKKYDPHNIFSFPQSIKIPL
ncbi:FAD/FMN-containing dehydrogenase [Sporomusaceae bacterium BoRhaA]|uniref:FAD-binding oxidoreductase n=1 Tax=Pelorhabdus rhamnosifermentans TaxID=2772457 RepID=UPI001C060C41|nr:FAD-binding oxidoreductase [Pelorhabdus rhamnosifermentans]MBU2703315.1 FAD/FMN-containing dehydrogenase [Pelorhabdus rhamnosifermentans]